MSVILITKHDENIYNITRASTTFHKKSPRYRSNFRNRVYNENKFDKNVKSHASMGRSKEPMPDPGNFLKKRSWKPAPLFKLPPKFDPDYGKPRCAKEEKLPGVPCTTTVIKEQEEKRRNARTSKNYIRENVRTLLRMKPKEPARRMVVARHGETRELTADLEGQFLCNPSFGKTPTYLQKVIGERQRNLQMIKDSTGTEQPKCRYITRAERDKLLAGLKQNWEELQKQYQGLPIMTDTIPKINRKSKMEADLKQLEKDIVLIERHPYIYVYDDDDLTN